MNTNRSLLNTADRPPLALIAGPTASGKSDMAVELALSLEKAGKHAVVINADSAQVYADLAVLSARPSSKDMRGIEHQLFGEWDGATACTAVDWATKAGQAIQTAHDQDVIPILVGGTGLYIRTLLDGISPVPEIDPEVRTQVRAMPLIDAYAALAHEDSARAAALSPNDSARICRALEVVRSTGKSLAEWQAEVSGGIGHTVQVHPLVLLPDRKALYARCDERFAAMLDGGAVAEVEALLQRSLSTDLPVMRAIGVPEISAALRGEITLDDARIKGAQATRNYAKRQYTWLRGQCPAEWPRHDPLTQSDHLAHFNAL